MKLSAEEHSRIKAADARMEVFNGKLGWQLAIFAICITILVSIGFPLLKEYEPGQTAIQFDFRVFWGAAKLALAGDPLGAFDEVKLQVAGNSTPDLWLPWLYAPGFLILLLPFGALPFYLALAIFSALSITLMAIALRPFVGGVKLAWVFMVFAPACASNLSLGQNSVIWFAGFLIAMHALRSGRDVQAGLILGILTLKPQLGLLIPLALVGVAAWRTIGVAAVTTLLVAGLPTLIYGTEYWVAMYANQIKQVGYIVSAPNGIQVMVSPYSVFVRAGIPSGIAQNLQWGVTLITAALVWWTWSKKNIGFDHKLAIIFCAMPFSSPYYWYYDIASLALAALFMFRANVVSLRPAGSVLLFFMWMGTPLLFLLLIAHVFFFPENDIFELRDFAMPLMIIAFFICLRSVIQKSKTDIP